MIKIIITIKDTPLPDGRFYGRIEAWPENEEPVSRHECMVRDMLMEGIKAAAEHLTQQKGITGAYIAEVPVKHRKKKNEPQNRNDRRS